MDGEKRECERDTLTQASSGSQIMVHCFVEKPYMAVI